MTEDLIPSVSVIMPCHNAEQHLPVSVGSVFAQTLMDWELILVDDGSQDSTLEWLQAQTDPRLRIHAQPNQGVSAARNVGLQIAQGKYVAFLDADDTWSPHFLEEMTLILENNEDAGLAYCGWQNIGLPGPEGQAFIPPDYETPAKREQLFISCRWPIHAALTRRHLLIDIGGFDVRLKNAEDYALWLEIGVSAPIIRLPKVLAYYHFHHNGQQASRNRERAALHHLQAQQNYLIRNPDFKRQLGWRAVRSILYGGLLRQAYACYWKRDIAAARVLFRRLMRSGYGKPRDFKYMLMALLPLTLHQILIGVADNQYPPRSNRV